MSCVKVIANSKATTKSWNYSITRFSLNIALNVKWRQIELYLIHLSLKKNIYFRFKLETLKIYSHDCSLFDVLSGTACEGRKKLAWFHARQIEKKIWNLTWRNARILLNLVSFTCVCWKFYGFLDLTFSLQNFQLQSFVNRILNRSFVITRNNRLHLESFRNSLSIFICYIAQMLELSEFHTFKVGHGCVFAQYL